MEKFNAINLSHLNNAAFLAFNNMILTESALIKEIPMGTLLDGYKGNTERLGELLKKYTETDGIKVSDADRARDDAYQHARAYARAMMDHYESEKAVAGAKIYGVFKSHGDALRANNLEESGIIAKVLADFSQISSDTLELIDFTGWVEQLREKEEFFKVAVTKQTAENSSREYGAVKNLRTTLTNDYKKLTQAVETFAMLNMNGCNEFIAHVNAYIQKVSSALRKPAKKAEESETDSV